jgi:threonine dehydrogenase-like Zn-dependent dehydrogenase
MVPDLQVAVQLVGPDRLELNPAKPVPTPGPTQILGRVECVGLCFSDMKLLHQFDRHPRKTPVLAHLAEDVLREIPSYVPGGAPTVPGHEAVLRVLAVGNRVRSAKPGGRYLVQADFRELKTAGSNGAFGYNFEGGLQEYVLLDERVTTAGDGESYLLPVPDDRAASQLALVEPWACVEDAFASRERRELKHGGTVLIAAADGVELDLGGLDLAASARRYALGRDLPGCERVASVDGLPAIDDLLIAGADLTLVEALVPRLGPGGVALIARGSRRFGRPAQLPIGRIHYGPIRVVVTPSARFADAFAIIPETGEPRPGDHVTVIGAGGPMGVMAVARAIAASRPGALIEGAVRKAARADALRARIAPMAEAHRVRLRLYDSDHELPDGPVDYAFVMAPVAELVNRAIAESAPRGIVNLFAGIPASELAPLDLDGLADKGVYCLGTSGSTLEDMRAVLGKVLSGELDTNLSVAAVSGMSGAIDGLSAVRDRTIAGKIVVYPRLADLPLTELPDLARRFPSVGALMDGGCWSKAAEDELFRVAK